MTTMDRQTVTPCNQLDPTPRELATLTRANPKPVTRGELAALRREVNVQEAATRREVAKEWTRPGVDPAWIERADAKYRKRRARYLLREAKR